MRPHDKLGQAGNAAIVQGHLGQGINVVADQYTAELRLETQPVAHETPAQKAPIHRVAEHQAAMVAQGLGRSRYASALQVPG
ncbi:hypothetical protein D3C80_1931360 [compost metagenome]